MSERFDGVDVFWAAERDVTGCVSVGVDLLRGDDDDFVDAAFECGSRVDCGSGSCGCGDCVAGEALAEVVEESLHLAGGVCVVGAMCGGETVLEAGDGFIRSA